MHLVCGPRQLFFFQCGPEMPKGWTPRSEDCTQWRCLAANITAETRHSAMKLVVTGGGRTRSYLAIHKDKVKIHNCIAVHTRKQYTLQGSGRVGGMTTCILVFLQPQGDPVGKAGQAASLHFPADVRTRPVAASPQCSEIHTLPLLLASAHPKEFSEQQAAFLSKTKSCRK